jgi:FtsZ-interacting cell division protein ZipA
MDGTTIAVIAVAIAAVVLIALALWLTSRRRSQRLQDRFGPEYDRTVEDADNRRQAEQELRERQRRHDELNIVPLDEDSRARYAEQWQGIQQRFVDAPTESVAEADVVVMQVMRDRGYPVDDFERRADDISVDHPHVVDHYRSAHSVAGRSRSGECSTEELREAVVHYRALFEALLEDRPDIDLTDDRRDVRRPQDQRPVDVTDDDQHRIRQF